MLINFTVLSSYFPVLIFFCFAIFISGALLILPFLLNSRKQDKIKIQPYECGIASEGSARAIFDSRFYLVAMLFIIFDVEVVFLIPWAISFNTLTFSGFFAGIVFLFVLSLCLLYEWKKGALEWD